ncbi:Dynein heavy chain, N-terminal region 2/Hydrolytic ATP binding site of dynein motor region/AAA domain (dynein-related subfamily)/Dynein heavy chain AAA lid domain/P-loop containing dynein motor region/AAA+ lid domain/P-loop containing dynein motor region D4/Microtubule-binding stalk of dynein motor/ATP-binding dynein motor region/Dynein heavy chain region D6 P-loop domain/Dynein heavy chain C-terminal domain containing protein, putative [Leishmania lindenbergi]|uniref:Dynein heavy chain, N-terminal region 2 n=1 Tax=Leishmania lindenbergi TaxID=651832 RepID=A0AAW3AD15_9TRYP
MRTIADTTAAASVSDDKDMELLRMIQKASRRPTRAREKRAAPNDEPLLRNIHTSEEAVAFFTANGNSTSLKYVFLNCAPKGLDFRPYDLVATKKGSEEPEHYILSTTGIVHVQPGRFSEVMTLSEWMKESSLFNILRKIPFFKNFVLYKAFLRLQMKVAQRKYATTRRSLQKDLLVAKTTFACPMLDLVKYSHTISDTKLIEYDPQGKHDYVVDDYSLGQSIQRQKASVFVNSIMEHIEEKVTKLVEALKHRADVPDINTREALQQYLLIVAAGEVSDTRVKRKKKSMIDAREDLERRMRELKRSLVEYSKLHVFIRLIDLVVSEQLFQRVLSVLQTFLNLVREQAQSEVRKVGFQVLLRPEESTVILDPKESVLRALFAELLSGCTDTATIGPRLCEQKHLKALFPSPPKVWNIGDELRSSARVVWINTALLSILHSDYEKAGGRLVTYLATVPHIQFLRKSWDEISAEYKQEANEVVLSATSLAKLYHRLQEAQDSLRVLIATYVGCLLWVNAAKLKTEIEPRMTILRDAINACLRNTAHDTIRELNAYFKSKTQVMNERPQALREFADYIAVFKEIAESTNETDMKVAQAEALCELMDRQQVDFSDDEDKQLRERTLSGSSTTKSLHSLFDEARICAEEFIEESMPAHVDTLQLEVANVNEECSGLNEILLGEEFALVTDHTEPLLQYLADINAKLAEVDLREGQLSRSAKLFNLQPFDWTFVSNVKTLYQAREEIWSMLDSFNKKSEYWFETPVKELDTTDMEEQVTLLIRRAGAVNRTMLERNYEDEVAPHLLAELQSIRANMPVIHDCGNKHMTSEHWNTVLKRVTGTAYSYHDDLNLNSLEEWDIFSFKEALAEQSGLATGEWKISNDLDVIRQSWDALNFMTKPYKSCDGVFILDGLEEVIQQLDDHQIELQTTMASRFVAPVRAKVEKWVLDLRVVGNVIEEWITLQKNWMYLEFIFSSDDIKEQLPEESTLFDSVDRFFRSLTSKAHNQKNVLRICIEDGVLEDLQRSNANIDVIQKKLEDYLETKRIAFPRFYFLSNDELLSILSDVRNPKAVQPHLSKCFDSIASLLFSDEECTEIVGMVSGEGEQVPFEAPVYPIGNVEQWLSDIERMMKASLLSHMHSTIEMVSQHKREEWMFQHPAQCIQAVDMIIWTGQVEAAIERAALQSFYKDYHDQILRMVELTRQPLSKMQRMLVGTLIVLNVHNRDIVHNLSGEGVTAVEDFAWYQQLRYYWESDARQAQSGGKNVEIRHCNAHLWYGYEYLGNQPRLVITPLTDRAFLTCTNALAMNLGAAPQGPAGTGKTESVKDLGKALARQVVVFNCSDGIHYKTMSRMFAGLAQAGAWACFDEFNRIELEVLSVIAQQMLDIVLALGQKLERMDFDGHPIRLSSNFGVFVTMNPGYAGRTELPDNLKALFRPICMMIPDYALIAEIMFYSEGFANAQCLAQKMVQLYKLSSEQLSKQDHYDFGMRAVKSILVMAGSLKRQSPSESEDMLLIRAMRDANVPKFLREDTTLFMALVKDLFPAIVVEENPNTLLLSYIHRQLTADGRQVVDGLVTKAMQLYDTLVVRHGVMLVGQTFTGKSTVLHTVQQALTHIKQDGHDAEGNVSLFNPVHVHLLNPKSVTMGELYGQVNAITREWTDGILSNIARGITQAALTKLDRQWIVFDGPVDAVWIENMNTVLDDNKLLCLFNGERIKLPATATFMFEVQDLRVASPATVSRCGMVYMEPYYLDGNRGWVPITRSLIEAKAKVDTRLHADRLLELLDTLLPDTLDFVRANCREWIPSIDAQLAVNCVELLQGFLATSEDAAVWPREAITPAETLDADCDDGSGAPHGDTDLYAATNRSSLLAVAMPIPSTPAEFTRLAITSATAATPDERRLFDMYFLMAFVWAIGGNLRDDARDIFSAFLHDKVEAVLPGLLPLSSGAAAESEEARQKVSLYDYVVHRPSMQFITWSHLVPTFLYNPRSSYFDLVVPTAEGVAFRTLLGVLTASSQHVLVNGVTGTGKSLGITTFLASALHTDDPASVWESFSIVFSAQTRSKDIENRLENKLHKIRSTALGPTPGKRAILFVDDINMPTPEIYGASPPLELLRQLISQGGFYDTHKSPAFFKELHNVLLLAACGVPGGGRSEMTQRLTSRFHLICQPALSESSTRRIFGSLLHGFLHQWDSDEIRTLSTKLVAATLACYERITQEKLPTPTRSHYTFNLRDIGKVIQGIMQTSPRVTSSPEAFYRLFLHEVSRTYHDRLVDASDRAWWWSMLSAVSKSVLQHPWNPIYEELLFGDFMRRDRAHYEEITDTTDAIARGLTEYQSGLNTEYNKEVELVFFKDAVQHVARLCRVLRQPRGHALVVGMGGSGRQSLCKLAAFICNLPIYEVTITRTFNMNEFHDVLKKVLLDSARHDKPVLFFLSDTQLVHEEMLEDINNLLNTGEVPNLMESEDVDQIVEAVRPYAIAAGKRETRNTIFSHFASMCRDQVHIVMAMSPVGEQFRRRLRMFPSLVNCCTIDWFDQWPCDALASVANRVLANLSMEERDKERLIELCVAIHVDVQEASELFYSELQRRTYTTPTSYLGLLTSYRQLLEEQDKSVTAQVERYQGGLDTLLSTRTMVDAMKVKLIEMHPKLVEAAKNTEEIMGRVEREQESAEVVRKQCAEEEEGASEIQAEADGIRGECQVELDKAMPILKAAEDALADLRPDDIREVRSFLKPAVRVVLVLEAVLVLLGEKDLSWDRAKLVMSRMDFIKDLQNYKRDDISEKTIKSIQKYIKNPDFQPEEVAKSSKACKSLSMWVMAMNNYYEVVKVVAPKRARLAEAEAKVAVATQALEAARGRLRSIEDKLTALQAEMKENVLKKHHLEEDIELTTVRLERAEQLMNGLASEQSRWLEAVAKLVAEKQGHPGTVALAAGAVTYLGPFTAPYRDRLLRAWHAKCVELGLPVGGSGFQLSSIMDPVFIRGWAQQGLPMDSFSVENGVVVTKSRRWCLCIDPQGQAVSWIRAMEKENNLRVVKLTDVNYMRTLENAIRVGLPVLIENVGESLDAVLDPVLLQQTYRSQGRLLIKLGDSEVDYDPKFRLYMTTKLSNPFFLPELQIKVTIVNFTVTQTGLENQLLADVVRVEMAELEQRADQTVLDIANGKSELKALESKILKLLASSTGNILDNEQLVSTLQEAKATSESVSDALRVAEETQRDIETARDRYRPVARRGATVYAVITELSGLNHMYQNSLDFFKQLFVLTLRQTEKQDSVDQRVATLLPAVTLRSYNAICRGLFEADKLIFAALLYVHVARQESTIADEEWSFLLKGSEGKRFVDEEMDPPPVWLTLSVWNELTALTETLPAFASLKDSVIDNETEWSEWYAGEKAYEAYPASLGSYSAWQSLLILKVLREDLLNYGLSQLIERELGRAFTESPAFDLEGCYQDSTPMAPVIFVLTPGTDPTQLFTEFADRKGFGARKMMLSLGQDQGRKAEEMIRVASTETGAWVYLQNCHVYTSWMPSLERILEELTHREVQRDFRLWLTTMPVASFPVLLLQSGVKVVKEPPQGLKANMRDAFAVAVTQDLWDSCPRNPTTWRRILLSLTFFHAVIQERRRFGPLGWNIPYEWNQPDLSASLQSLQTYLKDEDEAVPWSALRYMVGVINYGGRVTDFLDSRCLATILGKFFNDDVVAPNTQFDFSSDGVYHIPEDVSSLASVRAYLNSLPTFEGPQLFGLHANADIDFNKNTVRRQLAAILSMQPRTKAAAGRSPENKVLEMVEEFQRRLPTAIDKAHAHADTYRLTETGTMISLGTVASQEILFFNGVLAKLERTLRLLLRAIKGEVIMSADLESMFNAMLLGQVPKLWHDGSYLSRKPLASWYEDTLRRIKFFRDWNNNGLPTSFWISGFFFPQGFLTGVLQTHSRLHQTPIDEVKFCTHVTCYELPEDIEDSKESGVYIHGIFVDGAGFSLDSSTLEESKPGELYKPMPVIHLEPVRLSEATATSESYACPLYKTSARVGTLSTTGLSTNYVVTLDLKSAAGVRPEHWIERGVALLCMLDD